MARSDIVQKEYLSGLEAWYNKNARSFPWRPSVKLTNTLDLNQRSYHRLVSEFLLQQTVASVARDYFITIVCRWPTIKDIAAAPFDSVLYAWQGLGYYRRASYFWRTAKIIQDDHNGLIPKDIAVLQSLPGIGPYTARALAAMVHNEPHLPVDTNVGRVLARFYQWESMDNAKILAVQTAWEQTVPREKAALLAEAMIELGSQVCSAKHTQCEVCPFAEGCQGQKHPERYPKKKVGKSRPRRDALFFALKDARGRILMQRLSGKGVLAHTWMLPGTEWRHPQQHGISPLASILKRTSEVSAPFTPDHNDLDEICSFLTGQGLASGKANPKCSIQAGTSMFSGKNDSSQFYIHGFDWPNIFQNSSRIAIFPISHIFSHFKLRACVLKADIISERFVKDGTDKYWWFHGQDIKTLALSSLARKCLVNIMPDMIDTPAINLV